MGNSQQKTSAISEARKDFACRLRDLRVPRGFRTARSLARALEIDENRYTRYERAEVEPDLAMIRKICQILDVTPSELLGLASADARPTSGPNGHDGAATGAGLNNSHRRASSQSPAELGLSASAWALAEAVTTIKVEQAAEKRAADGASPLNRVSETGALFRQLMQHPFETIGAVLDDPAVKHVPQDQARELKDRIDKLVNRLKSSNGV